MKFYWTYILFGIFGGHLGQKIGQKRAKIFPIWKFSIFLFRILKVMVKHKFFVNRFFLYLLLFHFWLFRPILAKKDQNIKEQRSWKKLLVKSCCFSITLSILKRKIKNFDFWKILALFWPIFWLKWPPKIPNKIYVQ